MKKETILFGLMLVLIQIAGIAYATMSIQAKVESLSGNILLTGESIYLLVNVYGNNNEYAGIQAELNLSNTTIVNIDEVKGGFTGYDFNQEYNGSYSYFGNTSEGDLFYPNWVFYANYSAGADPYVGFFGAKIGNQTYAGSGAMARVKITALQKGDVHVDLSGVKIANESSMPVWYSTEGLDITVVDPWPTPVIRYGTISGVVRDS